MRYRSNNYFEFIPSFLTVYFLFFSLFTTTPSAILYNNKDMVDKWSFVHLIIIVGVAILQAYTVRSMFSTHLSGGY